MSKTISIMGCGWLGFPLAKALIKDGFVVKGSTTSKDKMPTLSQGGIESYLIDSTPEVTGEKLEAFFSCDVLFLNIPFRRHLEDPRYYQLQIQSVIQCVKKMNVKWVIFASSTSIYPEDVMEALEDVSFEPDNQRSAVLLDIERELLSSNQFKSTIIRFAGLYGENRQLGNFLALARGLKSGSVPVNLIHQDDCIGIIKCIIKNNIQDVVFNACSNEHPLRRDLYTAAAKKLNQPPPVFFDDNSKAFGKIVSNQKLKKLLNYQFQHPDPMKDV